MTKDMDSETRHQLSEFLLWLGDDNLILGHRLSEWCGHAPELEEDIALANIALDCLGQASALLKLSAELSGKDQSEDDLAFLREARDFKNLQLLEQKNGDFATTMVRQFLYDAYAHALYKELRESKHEELSGIAKKGFKEKSYHLRHSSQWIIRLGDGTEESSAKVKDALEKLWMFTSEMFEDSALINALSEKGIIPDLRGLRSIWTATINNILDIATLDVPSSDRYMAQGSREGRHSEHLGILLSEMQILRRSYPGAAW